MYQSIRECAQRSVLCSYPTRKDLIWHSVFEALDQHK